ncbi:hypothetical protein J2X02_003721 [Pseudoxanthomonas japonensis]|uniref:hypothetical protein n=1 Tax=Pseudoxanthomonas japonensis TaxID=69284 RepID=UPI00285C2BB1|nr:hypothetical protein [Pseudoxanthomonas japonensis]MDR7070850.1 hypothetical protein [Pseudoxanthomonas japonensis]
MSAILLFTVQEAFQLSGRSGPVLAPGIPSDQKLPSVRIGTSVRLVTPDGKSIDTEVAGVEMINYGRRPPPDNPSVPIALPSSISKVQVSAGTKVFLIAAATDETDNGA